MRYIVLDDDVDFHDVEEVLAYCISRDYYENNVEEFDEYLDEDGPVEIAGNEYSPSRVLYEVDSNAYDEAFSDWVDYKVNDAFDDARYALRTSVAGDVVDICDYSVRIEEDEDAEETERQTLSVETMKVFIENEKAFEIEEDEREQRAVMFMNNLLGGNAESMQMLK